MTTLTDDVFAHLIYAQPEKYIRWKVKEDEISHCILFHWLLTSQCGLSLVQAFDQEITLSFLRHESTYLYEFP